MRLELWRDAPTAGTFGNLYSGNSLSGIWEMFTLEPFNPIPAGEYDVTIEFWEKKGKFYPFLHDVPGLKEDKGVYIHAGNNVSDTRGCILVGLRRGGGGYILDSIKALEQLKMKIAAALELGKVSIKVFDPPVEYGDI